MDEFAFVNQYEVNEKRYLYWLNHPAVKTKQVRIGAIFRMIWTLLGLFVVFNAWKGFVSGEFGFGAVFVLLTLYCIYRGFLRGNVIGRNVFRQLAKIQGSSKWTRTIQFGDKIYLKENTTASEYCYDKIEEIKDMELYFALVYQGEACIYVAKDGFIQGKQEQFVQWVREQGISAEGETT